MTATTHKPPTRRAFSRLLRDVRGCNLCAEKLPLGPRPVVKGTPSARIMIVGQAPGTKVHQSGVPWDDASGRRLRDWLDLDDGTFYDEDLIAIVPMGFCYPGANPKGGDNPPRPECAPLWHPPLRGALPHIELTLLVGQYAQRWYLKGRMKKTMTETVRSFRDYLPEFLPTPHPSWRTTAWQNKNPWFEAEIVPDMRRRVHELIAKGPARFEMGPAS
ncbi:MAG: uracil-DNA glycosylase family protein [Rhodospirillaceae bacterium]|jgi:uracil-DNA glycosylase|nr:uracil-DNA glycosylase family protein [Rhodospirillaceae bacterium]MBT5458847.1 uracil-DNA glycosylase family protein [Rhodospirillaceae bacterium]